LTPAALLHADVINPALAFVQALVEALLVLVLPRWFYRGVIAVGRSVRRVRSRYQELHVLPVRFALVPKASRGDVQ
jgi:hypothetical protein